MAMLMTGRLRREMSSPRSKNNEQRVSLTLYPGAYHELRQPAGRPRARQKYNSVNAGKGVTVAPIRKRVGRDEDRCVAAQTGLDCGRLRRSPEQLQEPMRGCHPVLRSAV